MTLTQNFNITGIGRYLPPTILTSSEIEKELDLPNGWMATHVGVSNRHRANGLNGTDLGAKALEEALEDAGISITELDYLIAAAASFDHIIPNRSSLIKNRFTEAENCDFPCIDINTVCTSFITAMHYASLLLLDSNINHIAIVSSEVASNGLNSKDKETYGLFGDGAAAVILSKSAENGTLSYKLTNHSSHTTDTIIYGGGNAHHPKNHVYDEELFSFKMQGNSLLKTALQLVPPFIDDLCKAAGSELNQIDCIIPHQASKNGLKLLTHLNNGKTENIIDNLENQGNCIAASIPLALYTAIKEKRVKNGDTCILIGTAAGLSISGMIFRYNPS